MTSTHTILVEKLHSFWTKTGGMTQGRSRRSSFHVERSFGVQPFSSVRQDLPHPYGPPRAPTPPITPEENTSLWSGLNSGRQVLPLHGRTLGPREWTWQGFGTKGKDGYDSAPLLATLEHTPPPRDSVHTGVTDVVETNYPLRFSFHLDPSFLTTDVSGWREERFVPLRRKTVGTSETHPLK